MITKFYFFLALFPFVAGVAFLLKQFPGLRFWITAIHALSLTFVTLFFLNRPEWILSDEISIMQQLQARDNIKKQRALKFVCDNFICINNSFDKKLIPNPEGDLEDQTTIPITDRKVLSAFFLLLGKHQDLIDLVVCDMSFENSSPDDSLLRQSIDPLIPTGKFLVAADYKTKNTEKLEFPKAYSGNAREEVSEGIFLSHSISGKDSLSFAYRVFQTLDQPQDRRITINRFIPMLYVNDEELGNLTDNGAIISQELSTVLTKAGQDQLLYTLKQRKASNLRNIVFIGSFKGNEDVHKTAFGDIHGSLIIINVVENLISGANKIDLLLVLLLLVGFFIVIDILFARSNPEDKIIYLPFYKRFKFFKIAEQSSRRILLKNIRFKGIITHILDFMRFTCGFFIVEELHFFLLLLLVGFAYLISGVLINGISLVIYIAVFESILKYSFKKLIKD